MLSAKSKEGDIWIAGLIPDPKSREYHCLHCQEPVSHVSNHLRSGHGRVIEHFRHQKNASHAVRNMSQMQGDALEFILDKLSKEYEIEVFTDQIYHTGRVDIATDILAREHFPGGTYLDHLIQVEANPFNFNDFSALQSVLLREGVSLMPVLCAQGTANPQGKFFQDEYREASDVTVKKLTKNEKALYELLGRNIYFDHDQQALLVVQFEDYFEELQRDIFFEGCLIKEAGDIQAFKLKKIPRIVSAITGRFKFDQKSRGRLLFSLPRSLTIDDYFQKEKLAREREDQNCYETFSESVALMLDSCSDQELRKLTLKYGRDSLGGYAR